MPWFLHKMGCPTILPPRLSRSSILMGTLYLSPLLPSFISFFVYLFHLFVHFISFFLPSFLFLLFLLISFPYFLSFSLLPSFISFSSSFLSFILFILFLLTYSSYFLPLSFFSSFLSFNPLLLQTAGIPGSCPDLKPCIRTSMSTKAQLAFPKNYAKMNMVLQ